MLTNPPAPGVNTEEEATFLWAQGRDGQSVARLTRTLPRSRFPVESMTERRGQGAKDRSGKTKVTFCAAHDRSVVGHKKKTHGLHDYLNGARSKGAVFTACYARKRQLHPLFYDARDPANRILRSQLTSSQSGMVVQAAPPKWNLIRLDHSWVMITIS